jgi:hypothetical protein
MRATTAWSVFFFLYRKGARAGHNFLECSLLVWSHYLVDLLLVGLVSFFLIPEVRVRVLDAGNNFLE